MTLTKAKTKELWEEYLQQVESGELELIKDLPGFRRKWWLKQDKKCIVLNDEISFEDTSVDHEHRIRKTDSLGGPKRRGLARAILHTQINRIEGRIWQLWKRSGLKGKYNISEVLRGLAKFYELRESGNLPIPAKYIYPSEKPKEYKEPLTKQQYNKIKKYYFKIFPRRRKVPSKPRYMNKQFGDLLSKVDEYIENEQKEKTKTKKD